MRKAFLAGVVVLALATPVLAGIGPGTWEKSLGGMFHLSPEPWELDANTYMVYYISPMVGIGPFFEIQKTGDRDVVYASPGGTGEETCTFESAWHYKFGGLVKIYLPVVLAGGKITPYVAAGAGLASLPKAEWEDSMKEETESKFGYFGEFSLDYWVTDSWTIWCGFRASKVTGDADTYFGMYSRDLTDMRSQILIGISNFK
jgi:hypothetical protein